MARIEISKDTLLQPGDDIEIVYKIYGLGWLAATQVAAIESKLEGDPKYDLRSVDYDDKTKKVTFGIHIRKPAETIKVYEAGIPVTYILIAIASSAVLAFAWLNFEAIYKIVDSPAGQIALAGAGSLGIAAAILIILTVLGKSKG